MNIKLFIVTCSEWVAPELKMVIPPTLRDGYCPLWMVIDGRILGLNDYAYAMDCKLPREEMVWVN